VRLPRDAETCKVCGAEPVVGLTESHGESLAAVKVSTPEPELDTFTATAAGFIPPNAALNMSVDWETVSVLVCGAALPPPQAANVSTQMSPVKIRQNLMI
jgi:hypothetical protein